MLSINIRVYRKYTLPNGGTGTLLYWYFHTIQEFLLYHNRSIISPAFTPSYLLNGISPRPVAVESFTPLTVKLSGAPSLKVVYVSFTDAGYLQSK